MKHSLSETEEKIFEAALKVFSKKGRDGARMHEIGSTAGLNPALLHYYFGNKDDLYQAVLQYSVRRYMASVSQDLEKADSFEATLRGLIDGYIDFGMNNRDVLRLVAAENLSGGGRLGEIFRQVKLAPRGPRATFVNAMNEAIERGEVRPMDPDHVLLTIISACVHFLLVYPMLRYVFPGAAQKESFVAERKDHLFEFLYHGLAIR